MADNWQPGDLAMCIRDDWHNDGDPRELTEECPRILKGACRVVGKVIVSARDYPEHLHLLRSPEYLCFEDPGLDYGYRSDWFKKIRPLSEDEQRDFEADLRHSARGLVTALYRIGRLQLPTPFIFNPFV